MGIECGCKSDNCCHEKSFFEKNFKNPQIEPILEAETDSKRSLPNRRNIIKRNNMPCDMTKTNKLLDEINKTDTNYTNYTNHTNQTINGMRYVTKPCSDSYDECDDYEDIPLNKQNIQCDDESNSDLTILLTVLFQFAFIVAVFIFIARNI